MNMIGNAARGRGGRGKGRTLKVVPLQNKTMGPPTHPVLKRRGSSASAISSRINWKAGQASNTRTATFSATNSTVEVESTVILALTEGRGEAAGEVGIAAMSTSHPALILCQLSDSQSYMNTLTKINILNPAEILIPLTFANSFATNRLVDKLKEQFRDIKITGVTRSTFNSNAGMEYLKRLCVPSMSSIFLVLQHKYYALSAAAALLTYTESTLYVFYAKESIKVDYQESENSTIIDVATADRLELVASARPTIRKRYSCLLDVLNYCCTKIGVRTLRANILQPPCSMSEIESRLNCVAELIEHSDMLVAVQEILTKISNVDQLLILSTILPDHAESCSERQLNYLLTLNTVLEKIEPLCCIVENSRQPFFVELHTILSDMEFVLIKKKVRTMIHQNSYLAKGEQGAIQRCFAIKSGLNNVLDLMRTTYSTRLEEMRSYVKDLSNTYGLALTLCSTNKKGYHIVLNLNVYQKRTFKRSDIPEEFIQVDQITNSFTMKTQLLINLSHRLEDIMSKILTMSNIMIHNLLIEIHQHMTIFYGLCEAIAKLDMLQSLAQASNIMNYTRPKFGDYLELQESYHPLLYYLCSNPVPNMIYASPDYNMNIITGPNGSGKSIYIRQVVLLQVMAQVGCYVPAHSATFKLCDRILARVYLEDNIHYGASAFVLEMTEIKYFFSVLTNKTLIIIDEMCRSTSVEEGTALAMAICEKLLKTDAFVFFTTHYKHLANLSDLYYNIKTWQLETCSEMKNDNMLLNFTYNTIPGVVSLEHYGIFLARATWPASIMKYVDDVVAVLIKSQKNTTIQHQKVNEVARLKYDLEAELKLLKFKKTLTRSIINEKLLNFQTTLQGIGHNAQICVNKKMDGSSIRDDSFVDANEFVQIEVLAEVHDAPKDSTILNASEYTLYPAFPDSHNMLQTFDQTATFSSNKNKEKINCPELSFDNVQLSQIPSQSMMNLTPNENGHVNISRAISQKITPKHNLEYSDQYTDTYELLKLLNQSENDIKAPTTSLYTSSYSLLTNPNISDLDRTSQPEGTIYKDAQDCSLQNFRKINSSMIDSPNVVEFNKSIASLNETSFFLHLEGNPKRTSTPLPTKSLDQFEEIIEQQNSNSSRPQTNSNSINWTEKKKDDIKLKPSAVGSSKNDLNEILIDVKNCSEYFSELEWDHIDEEVYLLMQNQSKLNEQRSKQMKITSPDDESYGSKIRSNYDNSSLKSSIQFLEDESLERRKSNFDLNNGNQTTANDKTSSYSQLETCQESKTEKNSSEFNFSENISRGTTNSVLTSNCDKNSSNVLKERSLKQMSLANKVPSNCAKTYSDDIKRGSTKKPLISNSNQLTSTSTERNLVSVPSNSVSYSGWGNPRRGELNINDPRLKNKDYGYSPKADIKEPERNFFKDPIQHCSNHSGWSNRLTDNSQDVNCQGIEILSASNSNKSGARSFLRSEKNVDQRNTLNSDKNIRNKPEKNFLKDTIYEVPKIEFPSNYINYSKSLNSVHHKSTSSTSTSKVSEIYSLANSSLNSNRHSGLGNLQGTSLNRLKNNVYQRSITEYLSTSGHKYNGNGSKQNDSQLPASYGNNSNESNSTKNSSNLSDFINPQVEFNKWYYRSKQQIHHGNTTNHLIPNRDKLSNNELEQSLSKITNNQSNTYEGGPSNDDSKSDDIVNHNIVIDSGHKESKYLNTSAHFDKIRITDDELIRLQNNVHHGLEENLTEDNRRDKINILSNVVIKLGRRDFLKVELNGTDSVRLDKNCNVELEKQIINENVRKSNSAKSNHLEPGIPLIKESNNDDHREKNNSNSNLPKNTVQCEVSLISGSIHSKWGNSPSSNILEYLNGHVSPLSNKNYSKHAKSNNDNHESFTKISTPNRDQNTNVLEANYDLGNSLKTDTNLENIRSGEIICHENKSSSIRNDSVEPQKQVPESPILKLSKNFGEKKSLIKIDETPKVKVPFNQTLESLGDVHLELFSNDDTSDSNEEKEGDSDDADNENETRVENQTNGKRKRLGYTRIITAKNFEKYNDDKEKLKKPKFNPPYKTENSTIKSSTTTISSLSKRDRGEIYLKENREILESNNVSLYLTEIMNRPSTRQLKQAEHIVTAYKTNEGVLVVPAKKKNFRKKKFIAPLKECCGNFDVTIFSDKNSNEFKNLMNVSKNSRAGSAPFEVVSSQVISKAGRRSVFDKSNESVSFSDSSFFKSLNANLQYDKPNRQIENLNNSQHQKRIDSLLHKYLDTKSVDQSNKFML